MVLTTHQIIGGVIAKVSGVGPILALLFGIASHYLLDILPHWDYDLRSDPRNKVENPLDGDIVIGRGFIFDLFKIIPDMFLGLFLTLHFFSASDFSALTGMGVWLKDPILWGAMGGVIPDVLQFAYYKIKREPLRTFQKFHEFMHTQHHHEYKKAYVLGTVIQIFIITLAIFLFQR
jgi:hypothetical protein